MNEATQFETVQTTLERILPRLRELGVDLTDITIDRFSDGSELSRRLLADLDQLTQQITTDLDELERLNQQYFGLDSEARSIRNLSEPVRRRIVDSFNDLLNDTGTSRDTTMHRAIKATASYSNRILGAKTEVDGLREDEEIDIAQAMIGEIPMEEELDDKVLKADAAKRVTVELAKRNGDEMDMKLNSLRNILTIVEDDIKDLIDRVSNLQDVEYVKANFETNRDDATNLKRDIDNLASELEGHRGRLEAADTRYWSHADNEAHNDSIGNLTAIINELRELHNVQFFVYQRTDNDFARRLEEVKHKLWNFKFSINIPAAIQNFDESNFLEFPIRYHKLRADFSHFMAGLGNPEELRFLFIELLNKRFDGAHFSKLFIWRDGQVHIDNAQVFLVILTDVFKYITEELPGELASYTTAFENTITSIKEQLENNIGEDNILARTAVQNIVLIVRFFHSRRRLQDIVDQIQDVEKQREEKEKILRQLIAQVRANLKRAVEVKTEIIDRFSPEQNTTSSLEVLPQLPAGETPRHQIIRNAIEDYISNINSSRSAQESALEHLLHVLELNNAVIRFNDESEQYEVINSSDLESYQPIVEQLNTNLVVRLGLQVNRLQQRLLHDRQESAQRSEKLERQHTETRVAAEDLIARRDSDNEEKVRRIQSSFTEDIHRLERENAELEVEKERLTQTVQSNVEERERLQAERDALDQANAKLTSKNSTLTDEKATLSTEKTTIETERDTNKNRAETAEANLTKEKRERFIDSLVTILNVEEFEIFSNDGREYDAYGRAIVPRIGKIDDAGYTNGTVINIGRTGNSDIESLIEKNYISATHAKLEVKNHTITLTDLGSRNGTYIYQNGNWIKVVEQNPVALQEGSVVRFGNRDEDTFIIYSGRLYPARMTEIDHSNRLVQYNLTIDDLPYLRQRIQAVLKSPEYLEIRKLTSQYNNLKTRTVEAIRSVRENISQASTFNARSKIDAIESATRPLRDFLGI